MTPTDSDNTFHAYMPTFKDDSIVVYWSITGPSSYSDYVLF